MKFWWLTISELRENLADARKDRDLYWKYYLAKKSELEILQEAFRNGVRITDEFKEKIAGIETALAYARETNDDLDQRNRDLEYQNQLLVTVLQTLRIPVKLPARVDKTARK